MIYLNRNDLVTPPASINIKNSDLNSLSDELFKNMKDEWMLQRDMYLGSNFYLNSRHIQAYKREYRENYLSRIRRTHFFNVIELAVNSYKSTIFSVPPDRSRLPATPDFTRFSKDCDYKGHGLSEFMKIAYSWSAVMGFVGLLIDAPEIIVEEGREPTRQDEIMQDVRPYASIIQPYDILHMQFMMGRPANNKTIEAVVLRQEKVPYSKGNEDKLADGVKIITNSYIAIYNRDGQIVRSFANTANMIPFFVMGDMEIEFPIHVSALRDVYKKARAIQELSMTLDEMLHYNGSPYIIVRSSETVKDIAPANSNIIQVAPDENVEFLVLPVEAVENIQLRLDELKKEVRMMILKITTEQKKSNQIEGADSKLLDRKEMTEFLKTQTDYIEEAENNLIRTFHRFTKSAYEEDMRVVYERTYNLESMEQKIAGITKNINDIPVHSETLIKEREKMYGDALLKGNVPEEILQKIHQEIDKAEVTVGDDVEMFADRVREAQSSRDDNIEDEDSADARRILANNSGGTTE